MGASVSIKSDAKKLKRALRGDARAMNFAVVSALNEVAFTARKAGIAQMKKKLDRPTPFTLRAIRVTKASRNKLFADIWIQKLQWAYLKLQIHGGVRKGRRRAIPVPVDQHTNRYGNMPSRAVAALIAKKSKKGHGSTFSGVPRGMPSATPGIYMRIGQGKEKGRTKLTLKVAYTPTATYRSGRWQFFKINEGVVRNRILGALDKAIARELRRSAMRNK